MHYVFRVKILCNTFGGAVAALACRTGWSKHRPKRPVPSISEALGRRSCAEKAAVVSDSNRSAQSINCQHHATCTYMERLHATIKHIFFTRDGRRVGGVDQPDRLCLQRHGIAAAGHDAVSQSTGA